MVDVPILALDPELTTPSRIRAGDAAADLPARETLTIEPGGRALVPTGFAVAIPQNACGLVLPRSGLALNHGVTVLNSPGLIDSGYRGEIKVILLNTSAESFVVERGARIAQLLIVALPDVQFVAVSTLPVAPDERGAAGFGSSGA